MPGHDRSSEPSVTPDALRWNTTGGEPWVALADVLDAMFAGIEQHLAEEAATAGPRVLDVGCGTGATTVAMARLLGEDADCTGVDVSASMLAAARRRAVAAGVDVDFVEADAQRHSFAPGSLDTVASRFGVMFFDDPGAAFTNLRGATRRGGALRLVVWRGPDENPFMTAAVRAAAPVLELASPAPDAPGQFGFADPDRVERILRGSGWEGIELVPYDADCRFPEAALVPYVSSLGTVGRALAEQDETTRMRVLELVRPAFEPYVEGDEVHFTAACWEVRATAGDA